MIKRVLSGLMAAAVVLVTGCTTTVDESKLLRVGVTSDMPPIIFEQNGQVRGVEADMAREMAKELGLEPKFVELDCEDQLEALENGKIDIIMSGMSVTFSRKSRASFSKPYIWGGQLALIRTDDLHKLRVREILLLTDGRVAVSPGTTGEQFVKKTMLQAKVKEIDEITEMTNKLLNKKIDVAIHDAPAIWRAAVVNEGKGITVAPYFLTKEQIAWAVSRQNTALLAKVNDIREQWVKSGKMDEILNRWLPNYKPFMIK